MSKILVIEDNAPLAKSLIDWLNNDHDVDIVSTARGALRALSSSDYDLIILDLGLPDMSGQDLCVEIRSENNGTPILVLTATNEVSVKVNVLDIGADDYLTKPFYVGELKARLRALLRRNSGEKKLNERTLSVGDLTINISRHCVTRNGRLINLRKKEFEILEYLMRNHDTVVTRSMIINSIWNDAADHWHNTVDVHIKYLRDKVDRPFSKKLIKTVYGVGYMIDNND